MERYYTVDEIAKILSMHPKTIQRYIREDKLHATKVGKSWLVYEPDLKVFMKCSDTADTILPQKMDKTIASSVVDIQVEDANEAFDIEKYLTASMNSRHEENNSAVHTQYLECEKKLRITLWGNVAFMQSIFETLAVVIQNEKKEKEQWILKR